MRIPRPFLPLRVESDALCHTVNVISRSYTFGPDGLITSIQSAGRELLAAMNMTNINVQLLTIEAAVTKKKEHIYHAAMLDPHTSSELSIDDIIAMCDELIETHGDWLPKYH